MAFDNQIRIEQVFVFKGIPYKRQLKERQVYKTLSICVEFIKSDVNLKFRLKYPLTLFLEDVFKESNIRTVPCAYATQISNGLLSNLIQFIIKTKNGKRVILTSYWSAKIWYSGYCFLIFSTFSVIANLLAYVRVNFSF